VNQKLSSLVLVSIVLLLPAGLAAQSIAPTDGRVTPDLAQHRADALLRQMTLEE
jgi:hypothetical protein